jgi:hypothetical protein
MERTGCTDSEVGFNFYPRAGSPGDAFAETWEGFYDPNGVRYTIINLYDFCRRRGLDFPSMHRLAKGRSKLKSYKGWTHENSVRKRAYIKSWEGFIDPDGRPFGAITNLAAFCREQGLDKTHMVAVANGRITSHRGWTCQKGRRKQPPITHTGFIAPDGTRVTITNLAAFCRASGLGVAHMFELKSGKRRSHRGWTWRNDDEDQTSEAGRNAEVHESLDYGDQPVPTKTRP